MPWLHTDTWGGFGLAGPSVPNEKTAHIAASLLFSDAQISQSRPIKKSKKRAAPLESLPEVGQFLEFMRDVRKDSPFVLLDSSELDGKTTITVNLKNNSKIHQKAPQDVMITIKNIVEPRRKKIG